MLTINDVTNIKKRSENDKELAALFHKIEENHKFTISKIAHEIRNPATLINSYLQKLEKKLPDLSQDGDWLKIMENMAYLRSLLDELTTYNNSFHITTIQACPYRLLERVVESVRPILQDSNIEIKLRKETPIPILPIDVIKMEQTFLNLIRNAKEALLDKDSGTITISIGTDGSDITFKIADDGVGISKEYLNDIFTPFITHKKEGTGLGLPICKRVIEAHSGTISVETVEGEGTVFTIILPIC